MLSIQVPSGSLTKLPTFIKNSKKERIIKLQWLPDNVKIKRKTFNKDPLHDSNPLTNQLRLLVLSNSDVYLYSTFKYEQHQSSLQAAADNANQYLFGDYQKPWSVQRLPLQTKQKLISMSFSDNCRWLLRLLQIQDQENKKTSRLLLQRIDLFPDGGEFNPNFSDASIMDIEIPWHLTGSSLFMTSGTHDNVENMVAFGCSNDGQSILYCEPRGGHFYVWQENQVEKELGDWFSLSLTGCFPCQTNDSRTKVCFSYNQINSVRSGTFSGIGANHIVDF
jgi:hypothetical protein